MSKIKGRFAKSYDSFVKRKSLLPGGLLRLIKETAPRDVLEFGCGTGTVAVGLSLEEFNVTAVDLSADMLRSARKKSRNLGSDTRFINGDITIIDLQKRFDLLICLGNTLPLISKLSSARRLFANFARHLNPGGTLIIQQLNYDRFLKEKPKTFAVDTSGDSIRIKQYRYGKTLIDFAVTILDLAYVPPAIHTSKSKIRPWLKNDLFSELKNAGFYKLRAYGDYSCRRFDMKSKDLIVVGRMKGR